MADLLADYDSAPIIPPPADSVASPSVSLIVCSDHLRSQNSASLVFGHPDHIDPLFREAELPALPWLPLRYRASALIPLARALWLIGFSKMCESRRVFRQRAERAADQLIEQHEAQGDILLVGHGLINRQIARVLRTRGWSGPKTPSGKHWAITNYAPPDGS